MTPALPLRSPDWLDDLLIAVFLIGIYLNLSVKVAAGMPIPTVPAGLAGLLLLARHCRQIEERELFALLSVILLYLASILCAADYNFLGERFKGFVQLSYSLIIGYGLFITIRRYDRDRLARLFIGLCLVIVVGCALESHGGLRDLSDRFRNAVHETGIYTADRRDLELYGRIRPKFFTSEPSAVTFSYTIFAFAWYALSTWKWRLIGYLALLAAGFYLMRGPTLLIGFLLIAPFQLVVASRRSTSQGYRYDTGRLLRASSMAVVLVALCAVIATTFYAERIEQITSGSDPSFFYRVIGPALAAYEVVAAHPIAGAGLTGEEFVETQVVNAYVNSPDFSARWTIDRIATSLTNYFWYHWIYLGAVWGLVMLAAVSWLLRVLGARSLTFCWIVWAMLGQASGAYVAPRVWLILFLTCAVTALHAKQTRHRADVGPQPVRSWLSQSEPA